MKKYVKAARNENQDLLDYIDSSVSNANTEVQYTFNDVNEFLTNMENIINNSDVDDIFSWYSDIDENLTDIEGELDNLKSDIRSIHGKLHHMVEDYM